MGGRPKAKIVLGEAERAQLLRWTQDEVAAPALALRARIVLRCADGLDNKVIAAELETSQQTVSKWRRRFARLRVAGLPDAPRSGAPRTIDDARIDAVIARTLEHSHSEARCSTRSIAREMGISHSAVSRIWRDFGLKPKRSGARAAIEEAVSSPRRAPAARPAE